MFMKIGFHTDLTIDSIFEITLINIIKIEAQQWFQRWQKILKRILKPKSVLFQKIRCVEFILKINFKSIAYLMMQHDFLIRVLMRLIFTKS